MDLYIVQHQKFVSTPTWPWWLPNFSVSFAYTMPDLPANEANHHLILINLSKIDLFLCLFSLFPFPEWHLFRKDFPGKWFLSVDGCNKAHLSFTVKTFVLIYLFYLGWGSGKQILLNMIILIWNTKTTTSWLALCMRNSLNSVSSCPPLAGRIAIDRAPAALCLLSVTVRSALERMGCTLKLVQSQDGTEILGGTPTSVWALMTQAVLVLTHSGSAHRKKPQFLNPSA